MENKNRYAIVGLGGRHAMYRSAILHDFSDSSELVGLCDVNIGRLQLCRDTVFDQKGIQVPGYEADAFDDMIKETRPDTVIVTTRDCLHDEYMCRALEAGCNVITEKPMTTDAQKCQRILDAKKRTGGNIAVTFNYRYAPPRTQVKDLLMSGVIGDICSVDFHWHLDVRHGADYFRRWHRQKENSGGLMVHKATHHFDLVNWWLSSTPEQVFATGHRQFYTPETADRYGLTNRTERCHTCPEADRCPFVLDIENNSNLKAIYLDNEAYDDYYRDRCVFSQEINIEDSMNLVAAYRNGVKLSYSLNAFLPWEGYMVSFNGTKGRLEHKCQEDVYVNADGSVPGLLQDTGTWIHVYPHWQPPYSLDVWTGKGGHGGADPVMLTYIFDPDNQPEDKYKRAADERAGAWSILTGVAANHSMADNTPIKIKDLVSGLEQPDYPPMPSKDEPLPLH